MYYASYNLQLCDICHSAQNGILSCFCCSLQNALTKAKLDDRPCTVCDLVVTTCPVPLFAPFGLFAAYHNRQQLRGKYGLRMSPYADLLTCILCYPCFISQ
eukprot:Sspe_Gene.115283::Locus_102286_Transcript_1_1_Confidence_1.000_Length_355::g.115283::m.115283